MTAVTAGTAGKMARTTTPPTPRQALGTEVKYGLRNFPRCGRYVFCRKKLNSFVQDWDYICAGGQRMAFFKADNNCVSRFHVVTMIKTKGYLFYFWIPFKYSTSEGRSIFTGFLFVDNWYQWYPSAALRMLQCMPWWLVSFSRVLNNAWIVFLLHSSMYGASTKAYIA